MVLLMLTALIDELPEPSHDRPNFPASPGTCKGAFSSKISDYMCSQFLINFDRVHINLLIDPLYLVDPSFAWQFCADNKTKWHVLSRS